jgi:4-hydroxyproline epimerase
LIDTPMDSIRILDSHTGGEPTRLVLEGGPDLGEGPLDLRLRRFRETFDAFRSAIVNEPRGSDTVVGALLCKPHREECDIGVIFFNNVGYLGMCGHGTIGVIVSLAHLGMLKPGAVKIDTPVGVVEAQLRPDGSVAVANVPSYRKAHAVSVDVPGVGVVTGDVAWGGNWFFLVEHDRTPLQLTHVEPLTDLAWRIRQALNAQGYPEVDHVELIGPTPTARSRISCSAPAKPMTDLRAVPARARSSLVSRPMASWQKARSGRRRVCSAVCSERTIDGSIAPRERLRRPSWARRT